MPCQGKSQFAVCFETENISGKTLLYNYLLSEILGQVEVNQFDKLDVNRGILNQNVYKKEKSVLALEAKNFHFTDSGFFMLRAQVSGNNVNTVLEKLAEQMKQIGKLPKSEFERAKKALSLKIQLNLNSGKLRTTEFLKQQSVWGSVKGNEILNEVASLDQKELTKFTNGLLKNKLCFVVETPEVS